MPWVPESDPMTTVTENQSFSVTVQYYELVGGGTDPISGETVAPTPVYYKVNVSPQQVDPSTVSISGNGTTSVTISGYYGPCFDDKIKVMLTYDVESPNNTASPTYRDYDTMTTSPIGVGAWAKYAQKTDNFEIIDFIPDLTRTKDFGYSCVAYNTSPASSISSSTKYNRVQDLNWDGGKNALANAINSLKRRKV